MSYQCGSELQARKEMILHILQARKEMILHISQGGKEEEETNVKSVHMHVILTDIKELEELSQNVNILM